MTGGSPTHYTHCRHALCGVHLLRELTYFEQLTAETKTWAAPLKGLLLEMKEAVKRVRDEGGKQLIEDQLRSLTQSYERLVADGLESQSPPDVPEQVRKQARNLLLMLERSRKEVLLFLRDFSVLSDTL